MNYYWMYYNTTSGDLASQHSSHGPMMRTTTVTVGTDAPTVNTVHSIASQASKTTAIVNTAPITLTGTADTPIDGGVVEDTNGNKWTVPNVTIDSDGTATTTATSEATTAISAAAGTITKIVTPIEGWDSVTNEASTTITTVVEVAFDPNLLPANNALLGPYDDVDNLMPTDFKTAFDNPQAYLYQNGAFVDNPSYPQIQFNNALLQKNSWLNSAVSSKVKAGFPSSADGTDRYYAIVGTDETGMTPMQKWSSVLTMIAAGLGQSSYTIKDIDGNTVTLTEAEYKTFASDGFAYMNGVIEKTKWVKEAQIKACTTIAGFDTIGWPNPNPPNVPTGLTATPGTGEVSLAWTANTDVTMIDGGGYNVYVNGAKNNTSLITGTSYTVTSLTSGSSYTFAITAVDTDGNESAQTATVSATPD